MVSLQPRRAGRYSLSSRLASGGGALVLRATDPSGARLVFKLHPPEQRASALRELQLLGVRHPGLLTAVDAGLLPGDGRLFTVTDLVEGAPLAPGALDPARRDAGAARLLAARLLAALGALHARGWLHRDVKDDNVLLERGTGRPVLIDFGLCCPAAEAADVPLAGTPRAMAPELFAGGSASAASDLWAVGLVLAEALLGERLFLGEDPAEMADERESFEGLSERDVATLGDPVLARLLDRLLDPDPGRRPTSASAALAALELPSAERVLLAREESEGARVAALAAHDPRLAALREAVARGEAFVDPFPRAGGTIAAAFDEILGHAEAVERPTPAFAAALETARAVADPAPSHAANLLAALAVVQPLALWIDEHAATPETRPAREELARHLEGRAGVRVLRAPAPGRRALHVLAAWLGEQPVLAERLRATPPRSYAELDAVTAELVRRDVVALGDAGLRFEEARLPASWPLPDADDPRAGLDAEACAALDLLASSPRALAASSLRRLLGEASDAACARLLARGLVVRVRGEPEDLLGVGDARLGRALAAGLDLPAALRRALALEHASASTPRPDETRAEALRREEALAEAVELALLGPPGDAPAPAPADADPPGFAELVRGCAATLRRLNRLDRAAALLARGIAGAAPGANGRAALHLDRVDVLVRRLDFAAARAALNEARADLGQRADLVVREARVLQLETRSDDALALLDGLDLEALAPESAVLALQFRAEILLGSGRIAEGLAAVREAMRRHGDRRDVRVLALTERLGWGAMREGRVDEAVRIYERAIALGEELGQQALVATLYGNLGRALRQCGETRRGLLMLDEAVRRHELAGSTRNLVVALASAGAGWLIVGNHDAAREHFLRARRLAQEGGYRALVAQAANHLARVLAAEGRLEEAERSFAESLALRDELGDRVGQVATLVYRGQWWLSRGRLDAARSDVEDALRRLATLESADWTQEAVLLEAALLQAEGRVEEAARRSAALLGGDLGALDPDTRLRVLDLHARVGGTSLDEVDPATCERAPPLASLLVTRAVRRAEAGRVEESEADFERAAAILAEGPDPFVALRMLVERTTCDAASLSRAMSAVPPDLSAAGALASRLERDLAHGRALAGTLDAGPSAERLEECARRFAQLESQGDVGGLAELAERLRNFERLVEINKRLNTERDTQKLLDLIIDSAIELTGAARGFLILIDGRAEEFRAARNIDERTIRDPQFVVSHSVARSVVREARPLLTANAIDDDRLASAASISELKLLSILCVPLVHRGRALGAVYLDHPQVVARFHEGHLETVSSLAELAAIALENARLSEGLQRSNAELRTSQAEITRLNEALKRKLDEREEELEETRESLDASRRALALRYDYSAIVTRSPQMHEVLDLMDRITDTHFPVLIHGESGTGKELIARAIHFNGPRKERNFLSINCAAIAEPLIESELFGSVRGAFTGADRDRKGLFAQAHLGTLFLDEIGDMSLTVQKRLLRVLQEGEFLPVGGREVQRVDVRILCATHRDLKEMVEAGSFREDLYYRLVVARIDLPPLRERPEDVALLLPHFLARHGAVGTPRLDPEALALLEAQAWPGNVRELENFAMNLLLFDPGGERIDAELVRRVLGRRLAEPAAAADGEAPVDAAASLKDRLETFEREQVRAALERCRGNKTQAARELGVGVRTLYKMLERLGLSG